MTSRYLDAALAYVTGDSPIGEPVAVLPINLHDKRPCGKEKWGKGRAPRTPEQVREWWARYPEGRVAIILTPTRLVVLDVEGRNKGFDPDGVLDAIEEACGSLPATLSASTAGGGRHYYFRVPEGVSLDALEQYPQGESAGFEFRKASESNDGHYVAVPALMDGQELDGRAWLDLAEIAELPASLHPKPGANPSAPKPPVTAKQIGEGGRHAYLVRLGGAARRQGAELAEVEAALLAANRTRCNPPKPEAVVHRIAEDLVKRYPPGQAPTEERGVPEPVLELPPGTTGAGVLDKVAQVVSRFVVLPSAEALVAVVLFIAHTHAVEAAYCTPYLHVTSPERRSGKTQLLEVLAELVAHPMHASSMTAAVVYRGLVQDGVRRTLILDEVDTVFGPKPSEAGEALRQVLNAGNRRKSKVMRADRNTGKVEEFDPYGPKVLGGIGDLPETVADRSVRIAMRRALPEELAALNYAGGREIDAACKSVQPLVARWANDVEDRAATLRPERVEGLNARAMDAWEPLLALAELAGGEWPEKAREAAVVLSGEREADADSGGLARRVLYDCHEAFGDAERLSSAELVAGLRSMQDSPWRTLDGSGLDASTLSRLLRRYEVRPEKLRVPAEASPVRGYRRAVFVDPWARYVGVTDRGYRPDTRNTRNIPAHGDIPGRNTSHHVPRDVPSANPHGNGNVPGVPPSPGVGTTEQDREAVVAFLLDALRDGTLAEDADMSPYTGDAREAWTEALRRYAAGEEVAR